MAKVILMIAFDFPPSNAASVQRTLSFFKYLNNLGWTTIILTAKSSTYSLVENNFHVELKNNQFVYHATAFDVVKQLSFKGKHFGWMKTPDQYSTWIPFAIKLGKEIIQKHQPDVIWSTYPIPSVNIIANHLSKKLNIPWVADYRDPAPYIHTTNGKWLDFIHKKIDNLTLKQATRVIFTTREAKSLYAKKYSEYTDKYALVENGYDEDNFNKAQDLASEQVNIFSTSKFSLYYPGVLYSNGRNPLPLFKAIAHLKNKGLLNRSNFELIFQGAGDGEDFKSVLLELDINNLVFFMSSTTYLHSILNMTRTNALLLIQDTRFNIHIPGKIFEYFRADKPLLVIADKNGATAKLIKDHSNSSVTTTQTEIETAIIKLMTPQQEAINNTPQSLIKFTRKIKAEQLNKILLTVVNE